MDHRLTETQELLKRSAADFFAHQYPLGRLRELQGDRSSRDPELWGALVGLGWTAAPFEEEIGGFPGSFLEAAPLLEEMGHAAFPSPYVHSCVAAGLALANEPGSTPLATQIAAGSATIIWCGRTALFPPVGVQDGALNGRVVGVPWPELATHFLVEVDDGAILIEAAIPGVRRRNLDTSGAESIGEVEFDDAMPIATFGDDIVKDLHQSGSAGAALVLVGASQRALELAVEYAKTRVQFGQPIGSFQSIQHKCANMVVDIEVSRGLAYKAAAAHGTADFERLSRFSKALAADAARRSTREAIQIHGGVGFIDDHKVQLPYRLATNLITAYGAASHHRRQVADAILAESRR